MAVSMMRKTALKPNRKSLKVRVQRIKADMGKIREDQQCIRAEQRNIEKRFEEVKRECDELKEETQLIMKQSVCTQIQLSLMFDILRARKNGEFDRAHTLTRFLNFVSHNKQNSVISIFPLNSKCIKSSQASKMRETS